MDHLEATAPADAAPGAAAQGSPPRRHFVWRLALGCVVVLLASAGAAAIAVIEQVHTFVQDISVNKPLKVSSTALAHSSFGQPETLLMVGDDTRSVFKDYTGGYVPNLANEMLLVRIDPSRPWISMMSLPRELWVKVTEPDGVTYTNRLNSAYTYGTTTLLRTIKQVTGLSVNHVIATTFTQFEAAINKLGCIYDTVDERYYHNNADGGDQYQNIDLLPGYQCLNGSQAEMFVSYRHTDTSQVRDARDQSFLLAVKAQYGPLLSGHIGEFEKIFGRTVETDPGLRSSSEILNLANMLINAEGLRVRQVPFQTMPCSTTCPYGDLTATPQQIQASVHSFMFGRDTIPKQVNHRVAALAHGSLTATLAANVAAERGAAAKLPFTAEFPKVQDLAGAGVPIAAVCGQATEACIRDYSIRAPNGTAYPIYVEAFSNGDLGQYYDVQGTTWTSPPLLEHPTQSVRLGRRVYQLFYEGSHLETVAWHQHGAVYWIHNTLSEAVGDAELLTIAEQSAPVGAIRGAPAPIKVKVAGVPAHQVPAIQPAASGTPLIDSIGRISGLLSLLALPAGLVMFVRNRRRLRALRNDLQAAAAAVTAIDGNLVSVAGATAGTVGAGARPVSRSPGAAASDPEPSRLRVRSIGRISISIAVAIGLGAVIVGVVAALEPAAQGQPQARRPGVAASVAVLNAGKVPDAAHRLAADLTHRHVRVVAVGNLDARAPASYEVLYVPGEARQAHRLARSLRRDDPVVARLSASSAKAISTKPELVVVIP